MHGVTNRRQLSVVRWGWLCLAAALSGGLVACHQGSPKQAHGDQQKSYHLRGKVVATDASTGRVTVDHEAIPGFMGAMTMPYKLVQPNIIGELHPGDTITARLVVDQDAAGPLHPRLDEVVIVAQASPDIKPTVVYHVPEPGDVVPDFHLLNQSGKTIHLSQFRGRALLLTFIYTRCPLAEFCPRMSSNFAEIDQALRRDKSVYGRTHLLSVSFDPKYDTPTVLRSYGGAHTGRFTDEDFAHWDFAAPSLADLPKVEQYFDVGLTPGEPGDAADLTHSLSTVLIGKDGKVVAWYPTNEWKPDDVLAQMKLAAAEK